MSLRKLVEDLIEEIEQDELSVDEMTTTGNSGSDEGASVFINVPFFKGATEDIIKTTAYYSERNNMSTLTVLDSKNLNKNTQRRVTYKQNIDTTPPV